MKGSSIGDRLLHPTFCGGNGGSMKGSSIILLILLVIKSGGNGGIMKGSSIVYCHPEHATD